MHDIKDSIQDLKASRNVQESFIKIDNGRRGDTGEAVSIARDEPSGGSEIKLTIDELLKGPKSYNSKLEKLTAQVIKEKYLQFPTGIPYRVQMKS